ncbi:uncharacterized protein LOC135816234 isoform X2 [Sycon ciliatum]|uniref:uncharacterized protein LOC135816234 isoform X2 n=1 Tax=Sycon ciliatum TaxID=27933 RepID=UPI0031F6457C
MYTYHSISFSADHANQTCYQQYGGRPLSTDGQQLSCASKLLNTSQVLHDNNVSYIPVYTNATNGSHCTTYRPSTNTTHQDSCTAARPTICVSWYCNSIYNLLAVPGEDRCVCRPGYFISTPAHSCESIVDKLNMYVTGEGFGSSNVTVFSLIDSEWRVHRVFTQNTLYLLANLSLPEGKFAIRSAERIIYTFSESLADTVAAELAENRSEFFMVNNSSNNILPTDHLRSYLVNLSVWFRPYKVECVNIPSTNQSDTCSYSVFNESVPFKDGLYEFALSPHNSTLLSIPVLYTVYPRPTTTVPRMTSMPGNNASSSSDGKPSPSSEGSQPSMISSSPSGTDVAPPAKASMVGLYIGVGVAVLLAALVLIVCLMVVVHHNKDGVSLQHQRSGALEAAGERSANNRPTSGTGMRYQSVKHGSSSSVTATNSTQESTAAASSAQPSALHTSQGHNYDNIELTAHPTSTVPSSTGAMATPPGSGNEELSLHRPNRIPDAAVERAADNDYMAPHDLCLANDAGEDDLMTAAATTSMVSTPNTNLAATPKSTTVTAAYKSATTPITDASVSSAGTSATTPVFQSEEEARAASLPAAVAGPVYTEVFLTKKDVEPKRVLANPTAESVGLASDQDSYDSSIRGSKPPRTDYTPVIVYSKKTQNFCRGSVEE